MVWVSNLTSESCSTSGFPERERKVQGRKYLYNLRHYIHSYHNGREASC